MPNSLKRMAVPLALVGLVVLTLARMISDRRAIREGGRTVGAGVVSKIIE